MSDALLWQVLRVHPELNQQVTDAEVHRRLTADPAGYMRFLQARLGEIAAGTSQVELPHKAIFADGPGLGDFRVMPCVFRGAGMVVKTVKIVGTNLTQKTIPDQVTVGKAFRLEPDDNAITHVFDACLLSSARTGACAAIAVSLLAESHLSLAIVGAGRVGYYMARFVAALDGVQRITIHDVREERAHSTAEVLRQELHDIDVRAGSGILPGGADVIGVATTSREANWGRRDLNAPLVVSVGADTEEQRELDASFASAEVFTDSIDSVRVGDLRAWIEAGAIRQEAVIDLMTLLRNPAGEPRKPRVFVSTGSALFDNLTIAYLLHGGEDRT